MLGESEAWGTPRAVGMALRAAGRVEEAATVLESSPARLEHARALTDLGSTLRRANRRGDARDPLRRALDLADACGARPLAERARHELRAAGGRPRQLRISGVAALTPSERRIAPLAPHGPPNPQIPQSRLITK